jgi:hypothetical protein
MIGTSEPPEVVAAGEATPKNRPDLIGMYAFLIWGWIRHIENLQVDEEESVDAVLR